MPGGCSRNTVLRKPHPLYAERGEGCNVIDIDGVKRIDFANNMASLIHGHAHPQLVEAVTTQLQKGTAFTLVTDRDLRSLKRLLQVNRISPVWQGNEPDMDKPVGRGGSGRGGGPRGRRGPRRRKSAA